jgi:putative hydrolase of the HAD superfamily
VKLSGIRAVTFDVGDTLIEPNVSVGETYVRFAAEHGIGGLSASDIERRFRAAFRAHGGAVNTRGEWARIVNSTFAEAGIAKPNDALFSSLFDYFALPTAWRIFDDVLPTLEELSGRHLRLGIISNWDARLRPLLAALDLASRFDAIVVSCEAGYAKPAPQIFELAAQQLNLAVGEILHVGDSLQADVQGATSAGFCSVQLVRSSGPGTNAIGSLREIAILTAK